MVRFSPSHLSHLAVYEAAQKERKKQFSAVLFHYPKHIVMCLIKLRETGNPIS